MFNFLAIISGSILTCKFIFYADKNMLSVFWMCLGVFFICFSIYIFFDFISKIFKVITSKKKIFNIEDDFNTTYNELKKIHFNILETFRKKIFINRRLEKMCVFFTFIFLNLFIYCQEGLVYAKNFREVNYTTNIFKQTVFIMMIIAILGVIKCASNHIICDREYTKKFKKDIVAEFIKLINPNLKYCYYDKVFNREKSIEIENEYINANFDNTNTTAVVDNDNISGKIAENFFFNMSDVIVYFDNNGDGTSCRHFEGLFSWLDASKDIKNCLRINLNGDNFSDNADEEYLAMDHTEFEKVFDVYCNDKILATRILTVDIMQDIIDFYEKYKIMFEICYKNNKVYMRFFTGNMFEPKVFEDTMNINTMYIYYAVIKFVIETTQKISKIAEDIEI